MMPRAAAVQLWLFYLPLLAANVVVGCVDYRHYAVMASVHLAGILWRAMCGLSVRHERRCDGALAVLNDCRTMERVGLVNMTNSSGLHTAARGGHVVWYKSLASSTMTQG